MKTRITTSALFMLTLLLMLAGCKKDPIVQPRPIPGKDSIPPASEKAVFRFVTNAELTGQPYHTSNLRAVVSITNQNNEVVINEKILTLDLNAPVSTQSIELPQGNYKLTSFRLEYGSVNTHFVTPVAGSVKAASVQKPLALVFKIQKDSANRIPVEVLKVQAGEKPQAYGYSSGAFDYGQSDANPYLKIKMKAIMKIGDVIYDSVPASLIISTFNSSGEMTTTYSALKAGVNELTLLKSAAKYHFRVSRWGITDTMTLDRTNADEATVYTMGGSREAKKLKSERVFRQVNGTDVPFGKTDYHYNASGNISKIEYWLKKQDNSNFLSATDRFEYNGQKVLKISRFDEETKALLKTTSFSYDNQGKVIGMIQNEQGAETVATVTYSHYQRPAITIHYDNPGDNDLNYYNEFYFGNVLKSNANSTNGNYEKALYEYDANINPYRHMNWPDFYLSHNSVNNKVTQWKEYYGAYPVNEPYNFSYIYDGEGYPKELISHYKSYTTGKFLFSTKTIFVY
ncbi:MAG: hypothetical protein V4717_19165 [Bacteroidota bacterium]